MARFWVVLLSIYALVCYVSAKEKLTPEQQRKQLEPYMRDLVRLQSTQYNGHYRLVSNEYSYKYKDDDRFTFVFDSIIGAVVHAGYKTRQYHLDAPHPCVGLKKLYLYWRNDTRDYRLTTNYLDVHNKGDRQPIGMCGGFEGQCGADLPLTEYAQQNTQQKDAGIFYGTSNKHPDGITLKPAKTICYAFSRSVEQKKREAKIDVETNFNWGTLETRLVQIYSVYSNTTAMYFSKEKALEKAKSSDAYTQFAFNLISPDSHDEIAQVCELRPIAQYSNDDGLIVAFDDPKRDEELRKKGFKPYPDESTYILGYGMQKDRYCGSRIKYVIMGNRETPQIRVFPAGHEGNYVVPFHNGFFYSL